MKCRTIVVAAALVLASSPAAAQLYLFAGIGAANPKFSDEDFNLGVPRRSDTKDSTFHIGAGYRFSPHWAAEIGYADLGEYSFTHTDGVGDTFNERYRVKGLKLAALGIWPASERFSLYAKLGIASTKAEWEGNFVIGGVAGPQQSGDHRRNSLLAGFGAQYNITPRFGVRGEFENWGEAGNENDTGRAKMNSFNLLGVLNF